MSVAQEHDPATLGQLVHDCLDQAGLRWPTTVDRAAWPAVAAWLWRHPDHFAECDREPGLQTRVREQAIGGVIPAITDLLVQAIRARRGVAAAATIAGDDVVLPTGMLPPCMYPLEMNSDGGGPGFLADDDIADLVQARAGPTAIWQRWRDCQGGAATPAWIHSPAWILPLPAWRLPHADGRNRPLRDAIRAVPAPRPVLVSGAPETIAWALPLDQEPQAPDLGARVSARRRAWLCDPLAARGALLAATDGAWPPALAAAIDDAVAVLLPQAEARDDGSRLLRLAPRQRWLGDCHLRPDRSSWAIDQEGLPPLLTWLGMLPIPYVSTPDQQRSWTWTDAEAAGLPDLLRVAGWRQEGRWWVSG